MKKVFFLFLSFLLTTSAFAQDVCAEMMKFNDYKKNVNRAYRMTSTTESMGQKQVMERDVKGNMYMTMTMSMAGNDMSMEMILIGETMFMKQNNADWQTKPMDSVQINAMKSQWQNGQLQFFKNCKKLDSEKISDKNYRVYSGDFDPEKMKEMMSKSTEKMPANSMDMIAKMDMKMKFYVNDKDDLERCTLHTTVMGQSFDSEMVYEYDIQIAPIVAPPTAPVEKKD